MQGLETVVAAIIKQRTTLEQRDKQRNTPLQVAQRRQQERIVEMLIEAGAKDPNAARGNVARF